MSDREFAHWSTVYGGGASTGWIDTWRRGLDFLFEVRHRPTDQIISGYLTPDQRRALLSHLLEAEGLPGVGEIEKLRADVDNAYSEGYEDGFAEGYDNGSEDGYERGYEQGLKDGPEPDDTALAKIRQSRLHELLEAEARERVETWVDDDGDFCARIDDYYYVTLDEDGDIHFPCVVADPDDRLIYGIAAALAEKRRRESEVSE